MTKVDDILGSKAAWIAVKGLWALERLPDQDQHDAVAIRDLLEGPDGLYEKFRLLWEAMQDLARSGLAEDGSYVAPAVVQLRHGTKMLDRVLEHAIAKAGPPAELPSPGQARDMLMGGLDNYAGQQGLSRRIEQHAQRFLDS